MIFLPPFYLGGGAIKLQNGLNAWALRNIASTVFAVSEVMECAAGTSVAATLKVVSYYR